jgi:hypothetical protein
MEEILGNLGGAGGVGGVRRLEDKVAGPGLGNSCAKCKT